MPDQTARYSLLTLVLALAPVMAGAQGGSAGQRADAQPNDAAPALRLSLKDAVAIATAPEGNTRVQLAEEVLRQAQARAAESRAPLLPNVSASIGQQNMTRNLEAFGLHLNLPIPGFTFPVLVGPFNVFDARASASQTILNMGVLRRYQASKSDVRTAESEKESAGDEVRAEVARAYLGAVRAEAVLEAVESDVSLAEAMVKLANDQKAAGTGTGIEVTRARVQLANENQRLLVARNDVDAGRLQLLRLLHLGLGRRLDLTDKLAYVPAPAPTVAQALRTALEQRTDWHAEQKRLETARLFQSAARMDRLPSLNFFADYGSIGSGINNSIPTRSYGVSLQVPVFDGGRVDSRRAESASQYRQEEIRSEDLRAQIESEIRLALDGLQSARDQVKAAEDGLALAESEVAQAERRYRAGASPGLEVTDAQTRLERARGNRISALFGYSIARINLAAAMGTIRQEIQ